LTKINAPLWMPSNILFAVAELKQDAGQEKALEL
jgi:hypothetical protein